MFQYSLQQRFQGALLGAIVATTANTDRFATDRLQQFTTLINYLCQDADRPIRRESWDALNLTPLWLYTHESWRQRRNWLERIFGDANIPADQWLLSEAIAQVLRPDFRAATAVGRLRDQLTKHGHGTIADQLQSLAQWQADGAPLTRVITEVSSTLNPISSLLFALYCFLETPNMSAIAMARAQQLNDQGQAAQLTGILLGAYQGWTGFPLTWLMNQYQFDQIQQLNAQLMRSWSGESWSGAIVPATPVSAPR